MIDDREQIWKHALVMLMGVLLVVSGGCGSHGSEPPSPAPRVGGEGGTATATEPVGDYRNLPPEEFQRFVENHPEGLLLDVRQDDEWDDELGHLDGAVLIPDDQLRAREDELPADRSTPIMVYCRSGRRSAGASWQLFLLGYETVVNLDGGLIFYRDVIY